MGVKFGLDIEETRKDDGVVEQGEEEDVWL